jgi:parallel beta-helix repeat protein
MAFLSSQQSGGGVFCESTSSIITNCILCGCLCPSLVSGAGGGAVYQGTLFNCILSINVVSNYFVQGGAAYMSVLNNCIIVSNSASFGGGAAYSTLNDCSISGNRAPNYGSPSYGGGTYSCTATNCLIAGNYCSNSGGGDCCGTLTACILSNNVVCVIGRVTVAVGGGSYQNSSLTGHAGMLNNCLVVGNISSGYGGGLYFAGGNPATYAINCTVVGNTATNLGGGVYYAAMNNCIIYGNYCAYRSASTSNIYAATLSNCWTSDPLFVNPVSGNYQLQPNSPCINSGNNDFVSVANDLAGNPRIAGGTVDIGAYEYQTPSSILSYAWAQQYGLPTDGSADHLDLDGTGMENWQKSIADLNPTNPASVLAMLPQEMSSPSGVKVTWQSVNTRTYYLQRATNLMAAPAFSSMQSNLVGQAGTTSYTDSTATNGGPYFYRIGVQ